MLAAGDCGMWGQAENPSREKSTQDRPGRRTEMHERAAGSSICSDVHLFHQIASLCDAEVGPTHRSFCVCMHVCMEAGIPSFICFPWDDIKISQNEVGELQWPFPLGCRVLLHRLCTAPLLP